MIGPERFNTYIREVTKRVGGIITVPGEIEWRAAAMQGIIDGVIVGSHLVIALRGDYVDIKIPSSLLLGSRLFTHLGYLRRPEENKI